MMPIEQNSILRAVAKRYRKMPNEVFKAIAPVSMAVLTIVKCGKFAERNRGLRWKIRRRQTDATDACRDGTRFDGNAPGRVESRAAYLRHGARATCRRATRPVKAGESPPKYQWRRRKFILAVPESTRSAGVKPNQ